MAEVPQTVWLIGGLYLVDRFWANRRVRLYEAFAIGLVCGTGMMFKGHAGGLVFAPLAYLTGPRATHFHKWSWLSMWLVFSLAFSIPQLSWMARNRGVPATGFDGINRFRSILAINPNDPDSRLVTAPEFASRVLRNVRFFAVYRLPEQMVPGLWATSVWNWKGSLVLAMAVSLVLLVLLVPKRPGTLAPWLVVAPVIALNLAYEFGGSGRFWLPITTLLGVVFVINLGPTVVRLVRSQYGGMIAFFVLLANLLIYISIHEVRPYNREGNWRELADLFQTLAREKDIRTIGVYTQNKDAFQLMTGLDAPWGMDDLLYDSVVLNTIRGEVPPGSRIVVSRPPWAFVALAKPMTQDEIERAMATRR